MAKKIKAHVSWTKSEIKAMQDKQEQKFEQVDFTLFQAELKVKECLNARDGIIKLEEEQTKIKEFVEEYNNNTLEMNAEMRKSIADMTQSLQKQINTQYTKIDNILPRTHKLEG